MIFDSIRQICEYLLPHGGCWEDEMGYIHYVDIHLLGTLKYM